MRHRLKLVITVVILSLLVVGSSFYLPIAFAGVTNHQLASICLFISNTGGTHGVPIITLLFCFIIGFQFKGWRKKTTSISISLILFSLILGGFAQLNEHFIKEQLKIPRPNILFLESNYEFNQTAFYHYNNKSERRHYLESFLSEESNHPISYNNNQISTAVLDHWLYETGYSFPSGHSFNAFLMATLMGYILLFVYTDFRRKLLFLLPFVWAISIAYSRTVLGVHSAIDISIGALMGSCIGLTIASTGLIDKLAKQKIKL